METSWPQNFSEQTANLLDGLVESKNRPHAFLLSAATEKDRLAAAQVLTAKLNPPEVNLNEAVISLAAESVSVAEMRHTLQLLSLKPFLENQKTIAVINNADKLSIQAANVLLKTLEEPHSHAAFILLSSSGDILPTIVSRCVHVRIKASQVTRKNFSPASREYDFKNLISRPQFFRLAAINKLAELETSALVALLAEQAEIVLHDNILQDTQWRFKISEAVKSLKMNLNKKITLYQLLK